MKTVVPKWQVLYSVRKPVTLNVWRFLIVWNTDADARESRAWMYERRDAMWLTESSCGDRSGFRSIYAHSQTPSTFANSSLKSPIQIPQIQTFSVCPSVENCSSP